MDFTFGIITDGNYDPMVDKIISSIRDEKIPNYEIIIVGNSKITGDDIKVIPFDENIKWRWITRKKNIITENAKYENIVYLHDYVYLLPGWYDGWLKFGENFKACMNIILNEDGTRFRDWLLWDNPLDENNRYIINNSEHIIPYHVTNLSRYMYFSGAYWVAKKEIMEKYPLDERLVWNEGEDVDWSKRYRSDNEFQMNIYSTVKTMKYKNPVFNILCDDIVIQKLINLG